MEKLKYDLVLMDSICCKGFIDWTRAQGEQEDPAGREGLLKLQLYSAMSVANNESPKILLTSMTKNEIEKETESLVLSCLLSAIGEMQIPDCLSEEESVIKMASLLKWRGVNFGILTGNSLIYEKAKASGLPVQYLSQSNEIFEEE